MKKLVKGVTLTTLATMLASSIGCGSNFSTMIPMIDNNMLNSQLSYYQAKKLANRAETKDWTIFVHLAAENNLYSCGLDDINEMEAGLSATAAQNVNVIVLFDGIKNGDSVIYKIKPDKSYDKNIISEKINDKGEVIPVNTHEIDSGSKETFKKFLMWGVANFPAQNYMVDIWDHGSGIFRGKRTFLKKVFAMDDGTGSEMKTKDLNYVLPDVAKLAGKKIDILGFDACLMGHVEIGYQVKDSVSYLVASEETEPGDGWDYMAWLKKLSSNTKATAAAVGSALVETFGASYTNGSQGNAQDSTLAVSNLNALTGVLVPSINQFADALTSSLSTSQEVISNVRSSTQTFYNYDCADIYDFANQISKADVPANVKSAAVNVVSAMKKTVVKEWHGSQVKTAGGLVIYFPNIDDYFNSTYTNPSEILFAQEKPWTNFLKSFLQKTR